MQRKGDSIVEIRWLAGNVSSMPLRRGQLRHLQAQVDRFSKIHVERTRFLATAVQEQVKPVKETQDSLARIK